MESKKEIRKKVLEIRNELTKKELEDKSCKIVDKLTKNKYFVEAKNILLYINYGSEVITKGLIDYCVLNGKNVGCPKVLSDGEMQFYKITALSDLTEGYKGILEPATKELFEPDNGLVIVPGVAFDNDGFRIGYGKGFYDRYLKKHPTYKTIALAFSCQLIDNVPNEEHDIKVMEIISE